MPWIMTSLNNKRSNIEFTPTDVDYIGRSIVLLDSKGLANPKYIITKHQRSRGYHVSQRQPSGVTRYIGVFRINVEIHGPQSGENDE